MNYKQAIFYQKGIPQKLEKQTEFTKDETKLKDTIKYVETILTKFEEFSQESSSLLEDAVVSPYASKYNSGLFLEAQVAIDSITVHLENIPKIHSLLKIEKANLSERLSELRKLIDNLREEFAQTQREINDDTLDVKDCLRYTQQRTQNLETIARDQREAILGEEIKKTILGLARNRNEILKSIFDKYQLEINKLNDKQVALVINIVFGGNTDALSELIVQSFRGTKIRNAEGKAEQLCEIFKEGVTILLDILIDDGREMKKVLTDAEYFKFSEKVLSEYHAYVRRRSEDSIEILYHGKPLREHSLGQRASALVLSILAQDNSDIIIIDQPEDDLDNQVVYQEFIKTVNDKKPSVQFILATHNPNIPVLGDAERVIVTEFKEKAIKISSGNIDNAESRKLIVDIMEGGQEAFQKRNDIYMSWNKL